MVLGPKITQMFSEYHEGAKQSEWSPSLAYYQYIVGHYASILGSEMKLLLLINVHVLSVENGPRDQGLKRPRDQETKGPRGPVAESALEPTLSSHPHPPPPVKYRCTQI